MKITPNILALSLLIDARRYVGPRCDGAFWVLDRLIWSILWPLNGEEWRAGLLLITISAEHTKNRILS
jgi:hypothetical protein